VKVSYSLQWSLFLAACVLIFFGKKQRRQRAEITAPSLRSKLAICFGSKRPTPVEWKVFDAFLKNQIFS
jgi:hypothetical protein